MKAFVDKDVCIGCGLCVQLAPGVFEMDEAVAIATENDLDDASGEKAEDAAGRCPVAAITVS